jgi:Peptidase inhibitor I9
MPEAVLAAAENSNGVGNGLTKEEEAKIRRAADSKKVVKDKNGVARFIVDMADDSAAKAPAVLTDDAMVDWHKNNSKNTIQKVLRNSGSDIKPMLTLEHSLAGVIAYLTEAQVAKLAKDKLVSRITEDHYAEMSAPPPISTWVDTPNSPGSQTRS